MANDLLDLSLLLEISEGFAGQAAVDLQTVDKGGNGDEAVGLDFLLESLGGLLLKDDGVLGLVLDLALGPLLLLLYCAAAINGVSPRTCSGNSQR